MAPPTTKTTATQQQHAIPPLKGIKQNSPEEEEDYVNEDEVRLVQVSHDLTMFQEDIKQKEQLLLEQQSLHVAQVQRYKDTLVEMTTKLALYKQKEESHHQDLELSVLELRKETMAIQTRLDDSNRFNAQLKQDYNASTERVSRLETRLRNVQDALVEKDMTIDQQNAIIKHLKHHNHNSSSPEKKTLIKKSPEKSLKEFHNKSLEQSLLLSEDVHCESFEKEYEQLRQKAFTVLQESTPVKRTKTNYSSSIKSSLRSLLIKVSRIASTASLIKKNLHNGGNSRRRRHKSPSSFLRDGGNDSTDSEDLLDSEDDDNRDAKVSASSPLRKVLDDQQYVVTQLETIVNRLDNTITSSYKQLAQNKECF